MLRLHPDDLAAIRQIVREELFEINRKLDILIVPVAQQAGRQLARLSGDELKAHNKAVLAAAKAEAGMAGNPPRRQKQCNHQR